MFQVWILQQKKAEGLIPNWKAKQQQQKNRNKLERKHFNCGDNGDYPPLLLFCVTCWILSFFSLNFEISLIDLPYCSDDIYIHTYLFDICNTDLCNWGHFLAYYLQELMNNTTDNQGDNLFIYTSMNLKKINLHSIH